MSALPRHHLAIVPPDAALRGLIGLMSRDTAILFYLAMKPAPEHQPLVDARLKAGLISLVGLDIVGCDASRRPVDDIGLVEAALIDFFGRTFEQSGEVRNDRLVD